jgi:hypothetical protein
MDVLVDRPGVAQFPGSLTRRVLKQFYTYILGDRVAFEKGPCEMTGATANFQYAPSVDWDT